MASVPRRGTVAAALVLLVSCGSRADSPGATARVERLEFEAGSVPGLRGAPATVLELDASELEARASAPDGELIGSENPAALQLSRGTWLRLSGPFPDAWDQVDVELLDEVEGELQVKVLAGPDVLAVASSSFPGASDFRQVSIDLPQMHATRRTPTSVLLWFRRGASQPRLRSLVFRLAGRSAWLPPIQRPDLVRVGASAHRAIGLEPGRPVDVTTTRSVRVAFGLPENLNPDGGFAKLRGTWSAGDRRLTSSDHEVHRGAWATASFSPPETAGAERLTLRFELVAEGDCVAALSVPRARTSDDRSGLELPVVALVTSDTHRADHVGVAERGVEVQTPFLDALAGRGAYFVDCASVANITNPAHISLMTGLEVRDHRIHGNDIPVGDGAQTLAEAFAGAGWNTWAAVSVAHLRPEWSGLGQGFDRFSSPVEFQRDSSETLGIVRDWLDEPRDAPLFLWLHVFDAHGPYEPPEPFRSRYWRGDSDPFDPEREREGWRAPIWGADVTDPDYLIAQYKGEVSYLDTQLGSLFEHDALRSALTAVVADHGENFVRGPLSFGHGGLRPATLDVPLILAGPGVPRGERIRRGVVSSDLGRTLLDLAGLSGVALPGRNLLAGDNDREQRFSISNEALSASVREGRWMLTMGLYRPRARGGHATNHRVRLFDVEADPGLANDLLSEEHEVATRLRADLVAWLSSASVERIEHGARHSDADAQAQLAALGYAGTADLPADDPWLDPACGCDWCGRFR